SQHEIHHVSLPREAGARCCRWRIAVNIIRNAFADMSPPSKSLLRILPEEQSLRGTGEFLREESWPPAGENDHPRALRGLARIVEGGLCHRCGSCVGICPTGVLERDENEYPKVARLSACTDCDLCVKVCPGDEFNFHDLHQKRFGTGGVDESTHGE